jgi:hypothetical protein
MTDCLATVHPKALDASAKESMKEKHWLIMGAMLMTPRCFPVTGPLIALTSCFNFDPTKVSRWGGHLQLSVDAMDREDITYASAS